MFRNKLVCGSLWTLTVIAFALGGISLRAEAGDVFTGVRSKGAVRCGVSDGLLGFSLKEPNGRWSGLDADFCRAVAAAALGDPRKVVFVPLITSARFLALRSGQIDLLARHTTWTLGREAGLGVHFAGILYYDGQGFMVTRKSGIGKIDNLNGATICVEAETTSKENLDDYFQARGWKYQPVLVKSLAEAMAAFSAGELPGLHFGPRPARFGKSDGTGRRAPTSSCPARSQRSPSDLRCSVATKNGSLWSNGFYLRWSRQRSTALPATTYRRSGKKERI